MRLCFQFVLHRHGTRLLVPAAGLSAGRAVFLRSPARADTGIAATAAGTLLGMATMLAGSSSRHRPGKRTSQHNPPTGESAAGWMKDKSKPNLSRDYSPLNPLFQLYYSKHYSNLYQFTILPLIK